MTAQTATLMWSKNGGSISTDDGRKRKAAITEGWEVVTDAGDKMDVVLDAPGLPRLNDVFPGTQQIRVRDKSPTQVGPIFWIVIVTYEGEFGPGGASDSPLNDPPELSWGKVTSDEAIDEDLNGSPISTVNGEPIDGVTKRISDLVLTVKRNYITVNLPATHQYLHSVNSDTFAGFAPGTGRLDAFDAREVVAEEVGGYWEVTASIIFRYPYRTTNARAWWSRNRHEGFYIKDGAKITRAIDLKTKQEAVKPVLLKADGTRELNPANANWLEFEIYQPLPYTSLGLLS